MKSFIKGLWSRTKTEPEARVLDHPRALQIGDFLQMSDSYGLPEYLRDEVFEVTAITTWQFEHEFETTFSLQSKKLICSFLCLADGSYHRSAKGFGRFVKPLP